MRKPCPPRIGPPSPARIKHRGADAVASTSRASATSELVVLSGPIVGLAGADLLADPRLADLMRDRLEAGINRLADTSRRTYRGAHQRFAAWASTSETAARLLGGQCEWEFQHLVVELFRQGPLVATTLVENFLSEALAGNAPNYVNVRLAAIKFAFRLARRAGTIPWEIFVTGQKVIAYRDTRGPGLEAIRAMHTAAAALPDDRRHRDQVLLGLLFVLGLRRGEIATLRVGDVDLAGRRVMVVGKGRGEREPLTLPASVADAIRGYLEFRGNPPPEAPLIANHDRAKKGGRLTGGGIARRVKALAKLAGVTCRVTPHGFRHSAITVGLDALNGDVRRVGRFARHAKMDTTICYDDRRRDVGGEVSEVLAGLVGIGGVAENVDVLVDDKPE